MAELSSALLKKFVDLTTDTQESTGYYSYATAIVDDGNKYVQLDGSDTVTSVSLATDLATGDRVLVYVENHQASVIGNITYPASGRAIVEINEALLDFEELTVGDLGAINAEIEYVKSNYVETEYLTANYVLTEYLVSNYIMADTIQSTYATIDSLTALEAYVYSLEASEITVEYLEANYANITNFNALEGYVYDLAAEIITTEYLDAHYATIEDLEAAQADIYILNADYANLKYVLAGYESVGDLQSIHLTADNVVIDDAIITDAMIVDLSADKITAGTIYTARVRIQTDENDESLYMDNSLIQMSDETRVRLQAGKDATGLYNFYIWNENGDIMFDALGATANGIGTEVIVNTHVADNANIAGYKLDIDSVVSCINDNGNLEVDAGHVTINGNTLDFEIDTIIQDIADLELQNGITKVVPYFAVNNSDTTPPVSEEDFYPAYVNVARVNHSYVNVFSYDELWTEIQPTVRDGEYLWVKFKFYYSDDTIGWSEPFLLSDGYLRKVTTTLQTELEVVQGQITAKVWKTDIEETVTTAITDLWSEIEISIGDITLSVGQLSSSVDSLDALVSEVEIELGQITLTVSDISESAIVKVVPYFGVSNSNTNPPVDPIDAFPAYVNIARVNLSYVNVYDVNDIWTTEKPTIYDGQYLWARFLYIYIDGSTEWSDPFLYTDEYFLSEKTIIEDRISSIEVSLDDITLSVSEVSSDLDSVSSAISQIELTVNSISLTTSSINGGMASIILTNGNESSSVDVVTDAAEAFAYDLNTNNSSITITAGTITFNSGTLLINSGNFTLDADGEIISRKGMIGGWSIGENSLYNNIESFSYSTSESGTYIGIDGILQSSKSDGLYTSIQNGEIRTNKLFLRDTNSDFLYSEFKPKGITCYYGSCENDYISNGVHVFLGSSVYSSNAVVLDSYSDGYNYGVYNNVSFLTLNNGTTCLGGETKLLLTNYTSGFGWDTYDNLMGKAYLELNGNYVYTSRFLSAENNSSSGQTEIRVRSNWSGYAVSLQVGSGGSNRGVYDNTADSWIVYSDSSNIVHLRSTTLNNNWYTCGNFIYHTSWNETFSSLSSFPSTITPAAVSTFIAIIRTSSSSGYYPAVLRFNTDRTVNGWYYTSVGGSPNEITSDMLIYGTFFLRYYN